MPANCEQRFGARLVGLRPRRRDFGARSTPIVSRSARCMRTVCVASLSNGTHASSSRCFQRAFSVASSRPTRRRPAWPAGVGRSPGTVAQDRSGARFSRAASRCSTKRSLADFQDTGHVAIRADESFRASENEHVDLRTGPRFSASARPASRAARHRCGASRRRGRAAAGARSQRRRQRACCAHA